MQLEQFGNLSKMQIQKTNAKLVPNTSFLRTNCQCACVDREYEEKKKNPEVIWILDLRSLACT